MFNSNNKTPLFIGGYPKSGTTMLLGLLDGHDEMLVFPEELKVFQKILKFNSLEDKISFYLNKTSGVLSHGKLEYKSGLRDYSDIDSEQYMLELKSKYENSKDDKELFLATFDVYKQYSSIKNSNKIKYIVEKTPLNELYTDVIQKWFGNNFKLILVVRDPRDNYVSDRKKTDSNGSILSPERFAYYWKKSFNNIYKKSKSNSKQYLIVRYEDLISDFTDTLDRIIVFLDIEKNEILKKVTKNGKTWGGNSMFDSNSGDGSVHANSLKRYKEKLTQEEIELLEGYLYDEINILEYGIETNTSKKNLPIKYLLKNLLQRY